MPFKKIYIERKLSMPSTYAHYRFGQDVLRALPPALREEILPRIQLYRTGIHGPDIFFYYRPLTPNPLAAYGNALHHLSGRELFARMEAVRDRFPEDARTGLTAYIFGFICHYALDSAAHGTVYKGIRETGVSHSAIEADFDRELMALDGLDPARQPLAGHIVPSRAGAAVISRFFPERSAEEIRECLTSMKFFHRLLLSPGKCKREALTLGLSLAGKKHIAETIVRPEKNPACAGVVKTLLEKYEEALPAAVRLIETAFTPGWLSWERLELDFESDRVEE